MDQPAGQIMTGTQIAELLQASPRTMRLAMEWIRRSSALTLTPFLAAELA